MSWRIEDHPDGGLQITHLASPRFTARWTTGAFPIDQVREGAFFWTDEGGAPEDSIHLYDLAWDQWPEQQKMHALMEEAVIMIERHIIGMA
ncbi:MULTISPECIES: hypothetical protein [unclassified Roseivivax]|uniref:hypothetical protein n=1 Tax=unclassified Roseivivax TaxID=2639302 RepID=UPI001267AEC0|nr:MULTISPECIES: hypothetical protein [unclassified Roseivivax]QFT48851.1 hypothetical protein FIU97_19845 [Roseivivax sp. THAF40]QFT65036.1 hypothetical protein FIU91_19010 [Roseivivax sp. THAF30]